MYAAFRTPVNSDKYGQIMTSVIFVSESRSRMRPEFWSWNSKSDDRSNRARSSRVRFFSEFPVAPSCSERGNISGRCGYFSKRYHSRIIYLTVIRESC